MSMRNPSHLSVCTGTEETTTTGNLGGSATSGGFNGEKFPHQTLGMVAKDKKGGVEDRNTKISAESRRISAHCWFFRQEEQTDGQGKFQSNRAQLGFNLAGNCFSNNILINIKIYIKIKLNNK